MAKIKIIKSFELKLKEMIKLRLNKYVYETNKAEYAMSLMSQDNIWFYTQMKSGTTYTIIFLINYLNDISGYNLSKKNIFDILPYFHSFESRRKTSSISKIRSEQRKLLGDSRIGYFLHTHVNIEDFSSKRILMTRNPLDYIVSCYYFHYVNRGIDVSIGSVWKDILSRYIDNHKAQLKIHLEQPESTMLIHYEDLMKEPQVIFTSLVSFLDLDLDNAKVLSAIERSQKNEVKKIEDAGGKAIVAGEGFTAKSFVRSGEVGEWKKYIDDNLKIQISHFLKGEGIELHDFTIE